MLMKLCSCGNKIPANIKRCKRCEKEKKDNTKYYDKNYRKNYDIYHDKKWIAISNERKSLCNGLDIFAYFEYGIIKKGSLSHHIIEIEDDMNRAFDITNTIYVSDKSHAKIHSEYDKSIEHKKKMQEKLFKYIKIWGEG